MQKYNFNYINVAYCIRPWLLIGSTFFNYFITSWNHNRNFYLFDTNYVGPT